MEHPLLLAQVAKLHHREFDKEVASRQLVLRVKSPKTTRAGRLKLFVMFSFASNQTSNTAEASKAFSG